MHTIRRGGGWWGLNAGQGLSFQIVYMTVTLHYVGSEWEQKI